MCLPMHRPMVDCSSPSGNVRRPRHLEARYPCAGYMRGALNPHGEETRRRSDGLTGRIDQVLRRAHAAWR